MDSWLDYLKRGLSRKLPQDRINEQESYGDLRTNLKRIYPFVRRHWKRGVLGAGLILFTSLLAFPQPLIHRYLIDKVILGRQLSLLAGVLLLLLGIAVVDRLATLFQQYYFSRFEQEVTLDIQKEIFERALRFPKSFFDANQTGYLMSRLSSDVGGMKWFFSSTMVHICSNIFRFVGGLIFIFYLEWRIAIGVLIVLPGVLLLIRFFSAKMHTLTHHTMEQRASVNGRLEESLSTASLVKAFSTEGQTVRSFVAGLRDMVSLSLERSTVNSVANLAMNSMPAVARFAVLAVGAYWVVIGEWTLGSLFAFQAYLGYVFGPTQVLANANLQLQAARASLERVSALFDIVPEENMGTGQRVDHLKGEVEFREVSFSYDGREPVLQNISFRAHPGQQVAIVGPSGVGKTTLLSLILRFYRPTEGEVYFDGQPASELEVGSLRCRIGYVSQSNLLLSGSVMENLRYGNPEATEEAVIRAATVAGIHEFIAGLPGGYGAEVGQNGITLSEGQKQRVSLARALVKNPDILVLDEPSSAMDSVTERSVFGSLPHVLGDKTLFIVTHRVSSVKEADLILLLDESRLVAAGTHRELMKSDDAYRSLAAGQEIGGETGSRANDPGQEGLSAGLRP
jgi:ABC-type multidrug transport system fused ATPase/permease subunit